MSPERKSINIDDLLPELYFIFMTVGQAAIKAYQNGMPKEDFVKLCEEIWITMQLKGLEKFTKALTYRMESNLFRKSNNPS